MSYRTQSNTHNAVDAHPPFLNKHFLAIPPEGSSTSILVEVWILLLVASRFNELLGLWETDSQETNSDGEARSDPEDGLPGLNTASDAKIAASSNNIAK